MLCSESTGGGSKSGKKLNKKKSKDRKSRATATGGDQKCKNSDDKDGGNVGHRSKIEEVIALKSVL